MSSQAQYYEAVRRQNVIDHRQALGTCRQVQQCKYQSRYIPVGVLREDDMYVPWSFNPLTRTKLAKTEQDFTKKAPEIIPKPPVPSKEQYVHYGKLQNRFSTTNYTQQW